MVLQNYPNLIKMTSNTISIVSFSGELKSLRKIHFNTQWDGEESIALLVHCGSDGPVLCIM